MTYAVSRPDFEALAYIDELTQLPNARAIDQELDHLIEDGQDYTLLAIDVDKLKETNDRFGHEAGDKLLCDTAQVLRDNIRTEPRDDTIPGDVAGLVGRRSGDEFMIVLQGKLGPEDIQSVTERLQAAAQTALGVGLSIGGANHQAGQTARDVKATADQAMYNNKRERRLGSLSDSQMQVVWEILGKMRLNDIDVGILRLLGGSAVNPPEN